MAQDIKEKRVLTYKLSYEEIDAVNRRVLEELLHDPRLTMSELGRRVGMSSPAVTERVCRLEETGVIRGYRLELDPVALGLPIAAYVRIRPNPGELPRVADERMRTKSTPAFNKISMEASRNVATWFQSFLTKRGSISFKGG